MTISPIIIENGDKYVSVSLWRRFWSYKLASLF